MSKYIQTAKENYVTIKSFPHFNEHAVILCTKDGKLRGWMLDCKHGNTEIVIERSDI